MENTGIAAAGEAGIGGKAGIVGTDRDGGAGGGRDGECGVGSGEKKRVQEPTAFPPGSQRSKEPEIRRPG